MQFLNIKLGYEVRIHLAALVASTTRFRRQRLEIPMAQVLALAHGSSSAYLSFRWRWGLGASGTERNITWSLSRSVASSAETGTCLATSPPLPAKVGSAAEMNVARRTTPERWPSYAAVRIHRVRISTWGCEMPAPHALPKLGSGPKEDAASGKNRHERQESRLFGDAAVVSMQIKTDSCPRFSPFCSSRFLVWLLSEGRQYEAAVQHLFHRRHCRRRRWSVW